MGAAIREKGTRESKKEKRYTMYDTDDRERCHDFTPSEDTTLYDKRYQRNSIGRRTTAIWRLH